MRWPGAWADGRRLSIDQPRRRRWTRWEIGKPAIETPSENLVDAWVAPWWWWWLLAGLSLWPWARVDLPACHLGRDVGLPRWPQALGPSRGSRRRCAVGRACPSDRLAAVRGGRSPWRLRRWAAWPEEQDKTPSPNGGWPMSAAALALDVRLRSHRPTTCIQGRPADAAKIGPALRLVARSRDRRLAAGSAGAAGWAGMVVGVAGADGGGSGSWHARRNRNLKDGRGSKCSPGGLAGGGGARGHSGRRADRPPLAPARLPGDQGKPYDVRWAQARPPTRRAGAEPQYGSQHELVLSVASASRARTAPVRCFTTFPPTPIRWAPARWCWRRCRKPRRTLPRPELLWPEAGAGQIPPDRPDRIDPCSGVPKASAVSRWRGMCCMASEASCWCPSRIHRLQGVGGVPGHALAAPRRRPADLGGGAPAAGRLQAAGVALRAMQPHGTAHATAFMEELVEEVHRRGGMVLDRAARAAAPDRWSDGDAGPWPTGCGSCGRPTRRPA